MLSHDDACFVSISRLVPLLLVALKALPAVNCRGGQGLLLATCRPTTPGASYCFFTVAHQARTGKHCRHTNLLKPGEIRLEVFILRFETFLARSPCPVQPLTSLCRRRAGLCLICVYRYLSRSSSRTVTKIFCRPVPPEFCPADSVGLKSTAARPLEMALDWILQIVTYLGR